ncbi:myelin transcription factor 1, partial [Biomphalaria glabrata]
TYEHLVLPDISGDLVAGSATGGLHYRIAPFSGRLESGEEYMLNSSKVIGSSDQYQGSGVSDTKQSPSVVLPLRTEDEEEGEKESARGEEESEEEDQFGEDKEEDTFSETKGKDQFGEDKEEGQFSEDNMNQVMLSGDVLNSGLEVRPRVKLTTSNSGADIMLGLETDDGKSAEVEIDSLETDDLQPEDIPKGRVRKTSIVEKLSKSKESELIALSLMESAGQRQREFEKLISEHQELVHEISRTPSAENIVQSEAGRDP